MMFPLCAHIYSTQQPPIYGIYIHHRPYKPQAFSSICVLVVEAQWMIWREWQPSWMKRCMQWSGNDGQIKVTIAKYKRSVDYTEALYGNQSQYSSFPICTDKDMICSDTDTDTKHATINIQNCGGRYWAIDLFNRVESPWISIDTSNWLSFSC